MAMRLGRRTVLGLTGAILAWLSPCMEKPALAQNSWGDFLNPFPATSNWERGWGSGQWFNIPSASRNRQLGVTGTNLEVGFLVQGVTPNSGAARAGISQGDIIVCVGGLQVGRVGNQVFDLSEEAARRADSEGNVQLLVQGARDLQLRSLRVPLSDPTGGLTGDLIVRGGNLPADAIITVQLENLDRPYFVVRNGQTSFRPPTFGGSSLPFTVDFDPSYIAAGDRYRLRASITSNGRTIYETTQPPLVLTQGNPTRVQLILTPVTYGAGGSAVNLPNYTGYSNFDSVSQRITTLYQRYLGRNPTSVELAVWLQTPDIDYRLANLPFELMGAQEYFDRVGNNNLVWMRTAFADVVGREPSSAELDQWMNRFSQLGYSRVELLRQLKQVTGR